MSDPSRLCCAPSPECFNDLVSGYLPRLYALAYNLLGNYADAEDAVQEGLFNAFIHQESCQELTSFEPWLIQIIRNAALKIGREKGTFLARKRAEVEYAYARPKKCLMTPADEVDGVELTEAIPRIMECTTNRRQQICAMWCKGRTAKQIADKLNVSVATVRREWVKVKTILRDKLSRLGWSKV